MHSVHSHGAEIPALGFGTFQLEGATCRSMVETALELGYRHIDTAQMYRNEDLVGAAIAASALPRDDLFITTKVWPSKYGQSDFLPSVQASLERLQLDQVDLLLLHWPHAQIPIEDVVPRLNAARDNGLTRYIGVSNLTVQQLRKARLASDAPLVTNQVEYHPFLDQTRVLGEVAAQGMSLTAYSPLARGRVLDDPVLTDIARAHDRNPAQVALRWLIQQERVVAIPKASSADHAASNFAVTEFELSPQELERIHRCAEPDGRIIDPEQFRQDWD